MSKIIIVTGFLATLKTTISKRLATDLKINSTHKDDIKEILADTIGFNNREENLRLSKASFALIHDDMRKHVLRGCDLIIESNFKSYELEQLLHTLTKTNANVMIVSCMGQIDVLYTRYLERQAQRHHAHLSAGTMSKELFISSYETYHIPYTPYPKIDLDTTYFNDETYQTLYQHILNFLTAS